MLSSIPILGGVALSFLARKKFPKYCYEQPVTQSPCLAPNISDGTNCYSVQIGLENVCTPMSTVTLVPDASLKTSKSVVAPSPPTQVQPAGFAQYPVTNPRLECTCLSQGPFTGNVCTELMCSPTYSGELYVEIAGGLGADHVWYTEVGQLVHHSGGKAGHAFGTLLVNPKDKIRIQFGFSAKKTSTIDLATASLPEVPYGGGIGTLLSGSSGGGATVVTQNGTLVMVAAGGGGASRNADGGDAGCSEEFVLLSKTLLSTNGRVGFVNRIQKIVEPLYLSGGGATQQGPGDSSDPSGRGASLVGGSATESLSSGGGGGSGFYGGGAGFTNGNPKPRNTHGAGGGGSCYVRQNVFFHSFQNTRFTNSASSAVDKKNYPAKSFVTFGFPT